MLVLFHKPYQMLSQYNENPDHPEQRPLPSEFAKMGLKPLGRLDYDSEGLLLLSDSPRLERTLFHPNAQMKKTYLVQVDGTLDAEQIRLLEQGGLEIRVNKKPHQCAPALVELLPTAPSYIQERTPPVDLHAASRASWLSLTITEGKNRQVRRMTAKLGCPTLRLIRTHIGPYTLANIAPGTWAEHQDM